MKTLFKKELRYYLNNPIGYIIVILFAVFANFMFVKDIFVVGSASMQPFFSTLPWLLIIFVPALAMRILSEETRTNTIEVLLTLPVSETQIVLAKFFALVTLMVAALLLTIGLPVSLFFLARLYLPEVIIGYIGALFIASAFISVSMFFSSVTKNQVVALLSSVIALFVLLVLGSDFMANVLPRSLLNVMTYYTPMYHLQNFINGVFDLRSAVYFISIIAVFLFITIIRLEKRA